MTHKLESKIVGRDINLTYADDTALKLHGRKQRGIKETHDESEGGE